MSPDPVTSERQAASMLMGEIAPVNGDMIVARLSNIALDLNLALEGATGPTRTRVQRALAGIDEMIRDLRLLAVSQAGNGEGGAGRRQG